MVQDTGKRGKNIMTKKTQQTDQPIGKLTRVNDFLPPPEMLVRKEQTKKLL